MAMAMAMAMAKQQRSKSNWEGVLRWCWRSAHSDSVGTHRPPAQWEGMLKPWNLEQGTHRRPAPSDGTHYRRPPPHFRGESEPSKHFHQRGMLKRLSHGQPAGSYPEYSKKDVVAQRVFDIARYFKVPEEWYDRKIESLQLAQFEDWLDELQGYVESINLAPELHSINCLAPLLHHVLCYPHAGIRAKTAELVTTMVHNNPWSQDLVMEVNGLQPLLYNLTSDPDATSRTKALGAISALIRNNRPGVIEFKLAKGYAKLRDASSSESVGLQREALNLIQYLLHENSSDCDTVIELGLPRIMMHLASSDDAMVREAALMGLLVLARNEGGNSGQLVKNDDKLKQVLQERIEGISAMAPEDLGTAREEIQLVDSLWNACYNEPSSLKLFEPSLRDCAAAEAVEAAHRNSVSVKDGNIVTELGLPCIMIHLASSDDADVREAALRGLLVLARSEEGGNSGQLVKNDEKLKQVLQERIEGISAMAPEDLGVAREERHLVDSLWNACYNEPSFAEAI